MRFKNFLLHISVLFGLFSCAQGVSYKADELPTGKEVTLLESEEGVVIGAFSSSSNEAQQLSAAGDISGTALIMPAGALPGDTRITLELGTSLTNLNLEALGISGSVQEGSAPVVLSSSSRENPLVPMRLVLPIGLSLMFSLAGGNTENVAVIYKIEDYSTGEFRDGVIPTSEVSFASGKVFFSTSYFGSFQLVYTEKKVAVKDVKEVVTTEKIVTNKEKIANSATPTPTDSFSLKAISYSAGTATSVKTDSAAILEFSQPISSATTLMSFIEVRNDTLGQIVSNHTWTNPSADKKVWYLTSSNGWNVKQKYRLTLKPQLYSDSGQVLGTQRVEEFNTGKGEFISVSGLTGAPMPTPTTPQSPLVAVSKNKSVVIYHQGLYAYGRVIEGAAVKNLYNDSSPPTVLADYHPYTPMTGYSNVMVSESGQFAIVMLANLTGGSNGRIYKCELVSEPYICQTEDWSAVFYPKLQKISQNRIMMEYITETSVSPSKRGPEARIFSFNSSNNTINKVTVKNPSTNKCEVETTNFTGGLDKYRFLVRGSDLIWITGMVDTTVSACEAVGALTSTIDVDFAQDVTLSSASTLTEENTSFMVNSSGNIHVATVPFISGHCDEGGGGVFTGCHWKQFIYADIASAPTQVTYDFDSSTSTDLIDMTYAKENNFAVAPLLNGDVCFGGYTGALDSNTINFKFATKSAYDLSKDSEDQSVIGTNISTYNTSMRSTSVSFGNKCALIFEVRPSASSFYDHLVIGYFDGTLWKTESFLNMKTYGVKAIIDSSGTLRIAASTATSTSPDKIKLISFYSGLGVSPNPETLDFMSNTTIFPLEVSDGYSMLNSISFDQVSGKGFLANLRYFMGSYLLVSQWFK